LTWLRLLLQFVKLKAFSKFDNTTEALAAATALVESKLSKGAQQHYEQAAAVGCVLRAFWSHWQCSGSALQLCTNSTQPAAVSGARHW
jgi:hypothetical protein